VNYYTIPLEGTALGIDGEVLIYNVAYLQEILSPEFIHDPEQSIVILGIPGSAFLLRATSYLNLKRAVKIDIF